MNWSRGFFRIWIALSIVWFVIAGNRLFGDYSRCCKPPFDPAEFAAFKSSQPSPKVMSDAEFAAAKPTFDPSKPFEVVTDNNLPDAPWLPSVYANDLIMSGVIVLAVPLAVLLMGYVLAWIIRGFRSGLAS